VTQLPLPQPGQTAAAAFVASHLGHVVDGDVTPSLRFTGGQQRADAALAAFDVSGYASNRNEVYPQPSRGASGLSPYIRHGMLSLRDVWDHVAGGPERDVKKYRDELLWQEFSRHWYARLGAKTTRGVRKQLVGDPDRDGWDRDMACMELPLDELEEDGWLVNQTRMWLSSEWAVRRGAQWQRGEDYFFRHLLDGSRAANRLGWQWTVGVGSNKAYGFSRWQVENRAKNLCASCELALACPIEEWPDDPTFLPTEEPVELASTSDLAAIAGPEHPDELGEPEVVWLTAESLGQRDPALLAHPDLPAVFVFDEPLLASLRLSAKRLVFLTETLAEIGAERHLEVHLARPVDVLNDVAVAVTFAPVPGFARRSAQIKPAVTHPWPWLTSPTAGSVASFSAWKKSVKTPR
jgi:deoxyribodipyrimidine photo-lyase